MAITLEIRLLLRRYADLRVTDPGRRARMAASLAAEGQREPVIVVQEGELYLLVDGYLRVESLESLAHDTVEAVCIALDEVDALVLTWRLQRARRRSALEDSWLVRELVERHALSQNQVARRLQRSKGWISERLAILRVLPAEAQEAVRKGQIAPRGAMRFLVPMARRATDQCAQLITALGDETLTVNEIETLYRAWLTADEALRKRIVEHPLLYLKVEAMPAEEAVEPTPLQDLATTLESISGACRRARRRVRDGVFAGANPSDTTTVRRSWREARLAFEGLTETLATELPDA